MRLANDRSKPYSSGDRSGRHFMRHPAAAFSQCRVAGLTPVHPGYSTLPTWKEQPCRLIEGLRVRASSGHAQNAIRRVASWGERGIRPCKITSQPQLRSLGPLESKSDGVSPIGSDVRRHSAIQRRARILEAISSKFLPVADACATCLPGLDEVCATSLPSASWPIGRP